MNIDDAILQKLYGADPGNEMCYSADVCIGNWRSRSERHLHVLRRVSEPHDADVDAAFYATKDWLQQEGPEPAAAIAPYFMYYNFGRFIRHSA